MQISVILEFVLFCFATGHCGNYCS